MKKERIGGFDILFWKTANGWKWALLMGGRRSGMTFGPFPEKETAEASAWQWLKEGNNE